MAPKGPTIFCLLFMACTALVNSMSVMKPDFKDTAQKLMVKCQDKGHQVPKMVLLSTVFNNSDSPLVNKSSNQSSSLLSTFLEVLNSATTNTNKETLSQVNVDDPMTNKMWNCTQLSKIIKLIKNLSVASSCYMEAFVAPLSWTALTTNGDTNMSSDEYDTLLWAAKPALQEIRSSRINLPTKLEGQNFKKMMKMLQDMYDSISEEQKYDVVKWAKEQISRNYFNCTMSPLSISSARPMASCGPSVKWLDWDEMSVLGRYIFHVTPDDVDSSPKGKLCNCFLSVQSNSTFTGETKMNPSLGNKFLQKIQECFSGNETLADHVDKLGTLACYYNAPDMSPDLSRKFLSQLNNCDPNPRITQLKKRLVNSVMSNSNDTQALCELHSSVTLLSPKQLSAIPSTALKEVLKTLEPNVQWTQSQLQILVKKQLGDKKGIVLSGKELMTLQSIASGLPSCMLKQVKARDILNDTEALKNISRGMRKGQLKALVEGLQVDVNSSELVQKLSGPLLRCVSLTKLKNANITSLDQVVNKTWSRSQAAYLAKRMQDLKQLQQFGRLQSIYQGITCKMIDNVTDNGTLDMAQAITENPLWLSKVQMGCVARKLFTTLEKVRANYFKTITGNELDKIPTPLLLHLLPSMVNDLPDSVCSVFLDKMQVANLSVLPVRSPSCPALTQRALLCLGKNISMLTTQDVSRLGPFLCELSASQLRLMAPDVLNTSLQAMASCQSIPQRHRTELIDLVKQTFGDSSYWPAETMEVLGPLLLLDDSATSALPNEPWMKDSLYFLKSHLPYISDALKKKYFDLTTTKPTAKSVNADAPTVDLIENLGMDNVYWTPAQLDIMSLNTFVTSVETLGATVGYDANQLAVLIKKAAEAFGPASQMNESVVIQLGCITRGFSNLDLKKLPFLLETLEKIAHCGWNESQMEAVWKGVAKYNNLTVQQLGAAEIVELNRFICGLNASEIGFLNKEAFKDAVGLMDDIQCSFTVTQQLKNLAVSVFGHPSNWTEAQVSDLGNIIAGLNATELAALDPSVFSFVSEACIPLIPPANFAALSVAQLEALGPDNAAMVTTEQIAALRNDQRAALEYAETGSRAQTQASVQSGAPSLSVEGISAFMKPLLFLFMGLLLL